MSAYKRYVCESITNKDILLEALKRLGLNPEIHETEVNLENYRGKQTEKTAHIRIPRAQVNLRFGSASNDIGFTKTESGAYEMVISEYESSYKHVEQKIEQAYACVALEKTLKANRFQVNIDLSSLGAQVGRDIEWESIKVI